MAQLVLSDGISLAYEDIGAGRPLLLVHGWGAHGGFFEPQRQALASRFRIITLDLRGHGGTAAGGEMTVEQLAADVAALVEHLDLRHAIGVGWSMGAMVLWQGLLGGAADRFAGLVVVDMTARVVNDADWSLGLKGGYDAATAVAAQTAMLADWPLFAHVLAYRIVAEGLEPARAELIRWIQGEVAANDPGPLAALWGSLAAQDFRSQLTSLGVPTVVAHGLKSQLYPPETALDLERRLPNARCVSFDQSGHVLHLEEPDAFNSLLIDFADALPGVGARNDAVSIRAGAQPGEPLT